MVIRGGEILRKSQASAKAAADKTACKPATRTQKPRKLRENGQVNPSEHEIQVAVVEWAAAKAKFTEPLLGLLFAIPNGGDRHPAVAAKLKAEGVRPGVADLCLPVSRHNFHGLWIEMKTKTGSIGPAQKRFMESMQKQGYAVSVCRSVDQAINVLSKYMGIKE